MGNAASALPYTIGEETHPASRLGSYGFSIHRGARKSDKKQVTVFKGEKSILVKTPLIRGSNANDPSLTQIFPALHHYKKCKTLLHPHILSVHATLDTDYPDGNEPRGGGGAEAKQQTATTGDLIIVTEACVPLDDYLDELGKDSDLTDDQRADAVAWGIYCIIQAVNFLHNTAKVAHGNLCPYAIFVTAGGDWKLSAFHLLTPVGIADGASGPTQHFRHYERDVTPKDYRSPERIEGRWDVISSSPVHAMDSYSMGILLPSIYQHYGAGTSGRLPQKLEKAVQRLCTPSIATRPRILPLSKCPIFSSPHVEAQMFLDGIATQDVESKISFWKSLPDLFQKKILSSRIAKYKILPILQHTITTITMSDQTLTQDVAKRECLSLLPILFNIASDHLSKEEFQASLSNAIDLLFKVADRAIRGAMLNRISMFSERLDNATLNRVVFENMVSGFADTSTPLRELTLKSAVILVPYLTQPNLEKLTRYLVRLQSDTEDSIRTNTVIFISKVAPNLSQMARSKLILPAFTRSMSDPFVPCRLAGLKSVYLCRTYFEEKKLATEVLPAIVPSLVDGNQDVRHEAMRVIEELLSILRKLGDKMSEEEQHAARESVNGVGSQASSGATISGGVAPAPSSSSSYLSGLSSWISSSAKADTTAQVPAVSNVQSSESMNSLEPAAFTVPSNANPTVAKSTPSIPAFSSISLHDTGVGGTSTGWSDDEFDVDSPKSNGEKPKSLIPSFAIADDEDDFFSVLDKKAPIRARPIVSAKTQVSKGSSLKIEKVAVKKLPLDVGDGWDDF